MATTAIENIKKVKALNGLPEEHLQWIIDHSEYHEYEDGTIIMKTGDTPEYMMFIVEGVLSFYMDKGGKLVHYFDFANDDATGGVTGLLPYSRMKTSPGTSFVVGKLNGFRLHKKYFTELEHLNPDLIQRLIGYMTERARSFATTQLQYEKVNALGNLAAGIAHELNNPAAAINSISNELSRRLTRNYELTEKMLQCNLSSQQLHGIRAIVLVKENELGQKAKRTVLQRMEKEDEMAEWLEKNSMSNCRETAETFSEFGFSTGELENIRSNAGDGSFINVLHWLENLLSFHKILKDLDEASSRISKLVGAIKSHVHMDRTEDLQPTNIHQDIENTLTLLGYKLREKNITVNRRFCDDMPMVPAYVGELNQVWTNIIDNAIFAMPKNGELIIETTCDKNNVKVSIIDNGAGIPKEVLSRIFEPFFTTKKVGEGTGIGLDIVNRIIKHHCGEIKVNSVPGRTEFAISIPAREIKE
jgi:signal transduction histidine kinase